MTCRWWLCLHPLPRHTSARGCTVPGCLCHYTAEDQPVHGVSLAAVAWRSLVAVALGRGRVLVPIASMDGEVMSRARTTNDYAGEEREER